MPCRYDTAGGHFTLGSPTTIADLRASADGLLFAPNGDLLIAGQHADQVFYYQPVAAGHIDAFASTDATSPQGSFHLALDPSGNLLYTSDSYDGFGNGSISAMPLDGAGMVHTGTIHAGSGDDTKVASLLNAGAYGWFYIYDDGNPNGNGNFGSINMSTFSTTRLFSSVKSAHSLAWDSYTNRLTMFGGGYVGTWDPSSPTVAPTESSQITCDFDQGAVDGRGHAPIAGCNSITFIDYSASGDITSSSNPVFVRGEYINITMLRPSPGLAGLRRARARTGDAHTAGCRDAGDWRDTATPSRLIRIF